MTAPIDPQLPLRQFVKSHDFFIGIDSDGCAFDTMEVKHKECFIPNIIKFYRLAAISKYVAGGRPSFSISIRSGGESTVFRGWCC